VTSLSNLNSLSSRKNSMFIGNLFYKDKTGEIKELSARILSKKITALAQGRDFSHEELEHIVSVISFYLHNSKEHTLIDETDIELLVHQLYGAPKSGPVTIDGEVFNELIWRAIMREMHIVLPETIERRFYEELVSILVLLTEQHGIADISRMTVLSVIRDLCRKYTIDFVPPQALTFPLQEVLLLYARYSPYSLGDAISPVFNRYLYQQYLLSDAIKKYYKRGILIPFGPDPFQVDQLDVSEETPVAEEYRRGAVRELFIQKNEGNLVAVIGKQHLIDGRKGFIEASESVYGITYATQQSGFFDGSAFTIYPSIYNAELYSDDSVDIPVIAKHLSAFIARYSEYYFLIEMLKNRTLFAKIHVAANTDNERTRRIREELPENFLVVQHVSSMTDELETGTGIISELTLPSEQWNKSWHDWCMGNNMYMVRFTKEGT